MTKCDHTTLAAEALRGRLRRTSRLSGALALEMPDTITDDQRIALDRALTDVDRCIDRAALALGVRVIP